MKLNDPIQSLPLVGAKLAAAFSSVGVLTVSDLLYFFPTRYMDYRKTVKIGQAQENDVITVMGRIKSIKSSFGFRGRLGYAEAVLEDGTGTIKAIWFNQTYIAKQLKVGDDLILSGKVSRYKQLQFNNPAYEQITRDAVGDVATGLHTGRLVPIYRRSDLIPLRTMRRLIKVCLATTTELEDFIPVDFRSLGKGEKLLPITEAVKQLHFPETDELLNQARFRVAVDDVLPQQLAVQMQKQASQAKPGYKITTNVEQVKTFLNTLPFTLTASQKRAAWDIFQDLEAGQPMNRLLQGDVGSGKTIVAILAALQTAGAGFQTVLLAPTEILAKQHYDTFSQILGSKEGLALLTRTFAETGSKNGAKPKAKGDSKAGIMKAIESGRIKICIGTHALLQEKIKFKNLALVIIDEQHRFGVSQRGFLLSKSFIGGGATPHLLSMSATPIPRTLAMSLYADLEVSTLSQVPNGRKPVATKVVAESQREQAYDIVRKEITAGRQAFVVTPRVEESELGTSSGTSEVRSVKKEFARLQKEVFPDLKLGLLYGKMKGADKDKVMAEFAAGKLDILVSTSVIEIGIDIPNATTMIIEGAERFGLAQLHQLRGRIGRNNYDCHCFLFTTEASQQDTKRLTALTQTTDGFTLAELDLKERGFGDLFGKQQSGFLFSYPQFISVKALTTARHIAQEVIKTDIGLENQPVQLKTLAFQYLHEVAQD